MAIQVVKPDVVIVNGKSYQPPEIMTYVPDEYVTPDMKILAPDQIIDKSSGKTVADLGLEIKTGPVSSPPNPGVIVNPVIPNEGSVSSAPISSADILKTAEEKGKEAISTINTASDKVVSQIEKNGLVKPILFVAIFLILIKIFGK